ncbi:hypothetical protein U9M48_007547 [Paspalum notatum var. saurae]|uniref:Uncharacterized protein n=1 Tax=Paspalum notatum var. saurae TaxID=547442 RepID=A0AAQ3PVM5_PASNO
MEGRLFDKPLNPNKLLKEQFVSNLTGSSLLEIAALSTIVPALVVLRKWSSGARVLMDCLGGESLTRHKVPQPRGVEELASSAMRIEEDEKGGGAGAVCFSALLALP